MIIRLPACQRAAGKNRAEAVFNHKINLSLAQNNRYMLGHAGHTHRVLHIYVPELNYMCKL